MVLILRALNRASEQTRVTPQRQERGRTGVIRGRRRSGSRRLRYWDRRCNTARRIAFSVC
jgi:hypothetical protein